MAKIEVIKDDISLLVHTIHKMNAIGSSPMYMSALRDLLRRVKEALGEN